MADCKHERVIAWNDMETGDPVGLWSCARCSIKFYPATALQQERIKALEEALASIAAIEDQMYGHDWEEIEQARQIAREALEQK